MWKFPQLVPQVQAVCDPGGDGFNLADCTFLGKDTSQTVADVYSSPSVLVNTLVRNFFIIGGFIFIFTLIYVGFRFIISDKGLDEAKTILSKAEELNSTEPNLHNLRSMILFDEGNFQEALIAVEKAITLNNRQAYFYNNKGLYLLFLDRPEEAIDLINQSIQMDSKNPFALRNKGIYYVMKGDKITALQYLTQLAKDYPEMDLVDEYLQKAQAL